MTVGAAPNRLETTAITTTTNDQLANVPHPAGATHVDAWYDMQFGIAEARRPFTGSSRVIERDERLNDEDIVVQIDGSQGTAGDVTRHIMVYNGNREAIELSGDHARQFGLALIAAADEWDRLTA
jgi:hypothetical protein